MFLVVLIAGLAGLVAMALPAFGRHAHAHVHAGRALGARAGHAGHLPVASKALAHAAHAPPKTAGTGASGVTRFVPSPRAVFSLMVLYGAFANALVAAHLSELAAGLLAILPALLVERFAVLPLWNVLFRVQASPSSPLEELVLSEARATTSFKNGKGLVSVARDGRVVQFAARLAPGQEAEPVGVGDALIVEDVDPKAERVTVSVRRE
ncbi:MAG TPA: hypothetical protein VHB21_11135 [Minicystis sp.]|nr:hypothetical protein [Minicystis sp.]